MATTPDAPPASSRLKLLLRSLRHRNFRLFFMGQGISLIGTWMQTIALSWLVYRMTDSAFMLGVVGFAGQIPPLIVAPFSGVLADRWNRHRGVIMTQTCAMIQASILAVLTLTGAISIWQIIVLSFCMGVINAFDIPIRQSFLSEMVETKEDLANAIALNSSLFNGARLVGPAIAGAMIAAVGEAVCFLINAISFVAVLVALFAMHITPRPIISLPRSMLHGLKEGFRYAFGFEPIRDVLLLLALVSLLGFGYTILMPVYARTILHGDSNTFGFLMGAVGIGALSGALFLASRHTIVGLGTWIARASGLFGAGLVVFSLVHAFWLSLIVLVFVGFGMMVQMASSNTILQTIVDDDKRGRIMSMYTMAFQGMMPFGSLIMGSLASKVGVPDTLLLGGFVCMTASAVFATRLPALRKLVHPIYARMGIIPEVSTGLQSASSFTASSGT
jgi:MFS family permease